jgi:hypothetical protein
VVAHAWRVVEEAAEFPFGFFLLDAFQRVLAADGLDAFDAFDVSVVEVLETGREPFVPAVQEN